MTFFVVHAFQCNPNYELEKRSTFNTGYYTISNHKSSSNDIVLTASFHSLDIPHDVLEGHITLSECLVYKIGESGNFIEYRESNTMKERSSTEVYLDMKVRDVIPITTEPLKLFSGDSVHLSCYLQSHWRILANCNFSEVIESQIFHESTNPSQVKTQ